MFIFKKLIYSWYRGLETQVKVTIYCKREVVKFIEHLVLNRELITLIILKIHIFQQVLQIV